MIYDRTEWRNTIEPTSSQGPAHRARSYLAKARTQNRRRPESRPGQTQADAPQTHHCARRSHDSRKSITSHVPETEMQEHFTRKSIESYSGLMEQSRSEKIAELEAALTALHRREMRLRSILSSALVAPENRRDAHLELETVLQETREIEDQVSKLEATR